MRFEEVYDRWTEERLTQREAADVPRGVRAAIPPPVPAL
jgi:hypothetical protein